MTENELVRWLAERSGPAEWPVLLGIGDDMAGLEVGDQPASSATASGTALISSDMLLDGVHFQSEKHTLEQIGRKAVACSLSDCAAMAVRPVAATISIAWPTGRDIEEIKQLFEGMWAIAGEFECAIVGGDTTCWPQPLAIDVAMVACRHAGQRAVRRSGAQVGDTLYVTGPLGGSILERHMSFRPRIAEAGAISSAMGSHLHAMIDVSDGLAVDLGRICQASGVGAQLSEVLVERVVSDDARQLALQDDKPALEHALHDGEDFELLLAVAGDAPEPPTIDDHPLDAIGKVTEANLTIERKDGQLDALEVVGYDHLK